MPLEARTHQIALHPTWDSVVRLTTCPLQTDSQREPFQIQEMVSNLQPASSRTPNRSCVENSHLNRVTCLPSGQRNCLTWPNCWRVSVLVLYRVVHLWGSSPCFTLRAFLRGKRELKTLKSCPDSATGLGPRVQYFICLGFFPIIKWGDGQHGLWDSLQLTDSMCNSRVYVIA